MSRPIRTQNSGFASSSKRLRKTTPLVSHNATTGVFTVAAGFLTDLAPGDVVRFSGLTGGSGIVGDDATDYHLLPPRWNLGQATFAVSSVLGGPALVGGSNATAGTVASGDLTQAVDGVLSGNFVSQDSPAGR
jgi:hypothetical protein